MAYTAPQVSDFKTQFVRNFVYNSDPAQGVTDTDVVNAFNLVDMTINQCLWPNQASFTLAYLYLAAHFLQLNIQMAAQGLNTTYTWATVSRGVGSVNESFQVPERLQNNPEFMQYAKTSYGAMYLQLLWPNLSGEVFTVCGRTKP